MKSFHLHINVYRKSAIRDLTENLIVGENVNRVEREKTPKWKVNWGSHGNKNEFHPSAGPEKLQARIKMLFRSIARFITVYTANRIANILKTTPFCAQLYDG